MLGRSALLGATNSKGPGGFGVKYSTPATLPGSDWRDVAFSPGGDAIVAYANAEVVAYQWSSATGFGTKYTSPSLTYTTFSSGFKISFSPAGDAIVLLSPGVYSPYISAYRWSSGTGFGTRFTDPSTLPTAYNYIISTAFNQLGDTLITASGYNANAISAYPWSAGGFGNKYAGDYLNSEQITDVVFSPSGDFIFTTGRFYGVRAYPWTAGVGIGSVPGGFNSSIVPSGQVISRIVVSPAGDAVAFYTEGTSGEMQVYRFSPSSGFGDRYTNPSSSTGLNQMSGVKFSPDGNAIIYAHSSSSPYFSDTFAWAWSSATGFGTKYGQPATPPSGQNSVAFAPSGDAVAFSGGYTLSVYKWST